MVAKINTVLKKFDNEKSLWEAMVRTLGVSADDLIPRLERNRKGYGRPAVIEAVHNYIREMEMSPEEIRKVTTILSIEAAVSSKKQKWKALQMRSPMEKQPVESYLPMSVDYRLKKMFTKAGYDWEAYIMKTSNVGLSIALSARKRKTRVSTAKLPLPTFIVYRFGHPHLLFTKFPRDGFVIESIVKAFLYENWKVLSINVHGAENVMRMLDLKKSDTCGIRVEENAILDEYMDSDEDFEDEENIVDNTGHKDRRKFARKCYGNNLPTVKEVSLKAPSVRTEGTVGAGIPLSLKLTLKSKDVFASMRSLAELGVIDTDCATFVKDLPYLGKSSVVLKDKPSDITDSLM